MTLITQILYYLFCPSSKRCSVQARHLYDHQAMLGLKTKATGAAVAAEHPGEHTYIFNNCWAPCSKIASSLFASSLPWNPLSSRLSSSTLPSKRKLQKVRHYKNLILNLQVIRLIKTRVHSTHQRARHKRTISKVIRKMEEKEGTRAKES